MDALREGILYTWNSVPLRWLLPVVALVSFMASPYQTLMPIFAAEVFAGGADTLGFLIGAAGATLIVFSYSTSFALSLAMIAVAFLGMFPLGSLAAGAAASWVGAAHTLAAGGGACILCALWLWRRLPELRSHIRPIYVKLGIITE